MARRSYELVSGSDGHGASPSATDGSIVALYPVLSHFDIRRDYNPSTGEEYNVITENRDRPWYERQYVRVDWSKNLVSQPDFQSLWVQELFGQIRWSPVASFDTSPTGPDAMVADWVQGYFDVTSKWIAETGEFMNWGIPSCRLVSAMSGSEVDDCTPQDVTVRTAFMRVGERDYEVSEVGSEEQALFGVFTRDRYGYDPQYGITDKTWHRLATRHDLWQKSHDERSCTDSTTCGATAGSVCDAFVQRCTVPYRSRQVRTGTYYVSAQLPEELWDAAVVSLNGWNDAALEAIGAAREVECRRAGEDSCRERYFDNAKATGEQAFVLCHNPVRVGDRAECGAAGLAVRPGDLRYHMLGWVDMPLEGAPLGYGPNGADPLSGEVVQSTAWVYGATLDMYAALARDLVSMINGDLDPAAFSQGQHVGGSSVASPLDTQVFRSYAMSLRGDNARTWTDTELRSRLAGLESGGLLGPAGLQQGTAAQRLAAVDAFVAGRGVAGDPGFGGAAEADARFASMAARLRGGKTEAALLDDGFVLASAPGPVDETAAGIGNMRSLVTPFGGLGPFQAASLASRVRKLLELRGACLFGATEFDAPHLEGIARRLATKYRDVSPEERADRVFHELRIAMFKAVAEYELGHTMGLRHNFQASWDSLNYHPNYWRLRTANNTALGLCTGARTDASAPDLCMGPRYLDPVTLEEQGTRGAPHASIEAFASSSIMDYGYDFDSDLTGLGAYDRAAMKFVYAKVAEVVAGDDLAQALAPVHSSPLEDRWMVRRVDDAIPGGLQVQPTHYTTLARLLQSRNVLFDPSRSRAPGPFEEGATVDGVVYTPARREHVAVEELVSGPLVGIDAGRSAPLWKTVDGRIRWPYRFGADEYGDYPHIQRFDNGADLFEVSENLAHYYESRYVLDYFRRGRRGWMPYLMVGRLWDRYFSRMQALGWRASTRTALYGALFPADNPALRSDDWGRGDGMALTSLFETLQRSLLRPQPGGYSAPDTTATPPVPGQRLAVFQVPEFAGGDGVFQIGVLEGRYIDDDLDMVRGGSFHYQAYLERFGVHVEKPLAAAALFVLRPPVNDATRQTFVDGRNVLASFHTALPKVVERLLAGVLGADTDAVAPWVEARGGLQSVRYPRPWEDGWQRTGTLPTLVDPLVGFRQEVPAIVYALVFGSEDSSMDFANKLRIWVDGGIEGLGLLESEKVFFFEPGSGLTWVARSYGREGIASGAEREVGVGARMLEQANALLGGAFRVVVDGTTGKPQYDAATRRPIWEAGARVGETRAEGAVEKQAALMALQRFERYVGLINVVRQAMVEMGIGPLQQTRP